MRLQIKIILKIQIYFRLLLSKNVNYVQTKPQFISQDVKNNIKRMAMEQSLYAQVIKFQRKGFKFDAADKNKNPSKFKFQGQSARSRYWFDLDLDWIDIDFSTREPDFYKKLFQNNDNEQEAGSFRIFEVPIGNEKVVKSFVFHKYAPTLIYRQKSLNSCCFSSLASDFASINQIKAADAISLRIKESLKSEVRNRIHFATDIMQNKKRN